MNQQMNKDCCYLCDTYLTSIPNNEKEELKKSELERILTVKKYLPTINKRQFDLICESCLNYILDFDEVRKKWENNESIFKQKTQDRSKGFRGISRSKNKKCTYICRLCLKAITTQEVTFVYHDDQVYETSYVHKVLSLHSPHTDLSLTENPVICNECLDEVQTFDAFHQMWMEVQGSQVQSSGCKFNSCDSGIVQQLRKFDDKETKTSGNLMEEESIGSILSNAENLPSDMLALTNGISAGITSNDDIFLISDDEEMENQINTSAKIGVDTSTEAESAVRGLLNDQDSVCGTPVEFHNEICTVSDDENMIEPSIDINQNSSAISRVYDLAQIIPVKENIPPDISNDDVRQVNLSKSESLSCEIESVVLFSSGQVQDNSDTYNDGFSLKNVAESSWSVQKEFAFVDIDDSDSQDSDDCEAINMPLLPKISNVCSVDENDIPMNETKIFEDNSLQHFGSNTDFSNVSPAEITPSIEINMTKVKELFQTSPGDAIVVIDDENEFEISPQDVPSLELNMSKVKELFQDVNNRESNLEENLSDFLKFNKPNNSKRSMDESNELLDFEHQIELDAHVKKFKVDANSKSLPKHDNTFSSAFRDFVETKVKIPEQSSSNPKNSAETLDVKLFSEDIFECYCKWFPYKPLISCKGSSISKIKGTVMENSVGYQIYQCNKCLFVTDKECELVNHHCVKKKPKERFWCRKRKCRFSANQEKQFVLHNLFHNIEELGWLKCTVCEFRALDDLSMSEHRKLSHQMGIVQRHSKCPNCYFESDEPQILSHHIRTRHRLHKKKTPYKKNKKV